MKQTAYLLGPMSGYPDMNRPLFNSWARKLRKQFLVINPADLDAELPKPESEPYEWYYARDLPFVAKCHVGLAIPGWTQSTGAKTEAYLIGVLLKRPILSLPDLTPISPGYLPRLTLPRAGQLGVN